MLSHLDAVRSNRQPVSEDNAFWQAQKLFSDWVETSLDTYRDMRDHMLEAWFNATYGSPFLQALVGLGTLNGSGRQRIGDSPAHIAMLEQRIGELKRAIADGGPREAIIRALLYIRIPDGAADERGFNFLRRLRSEAGKGVSLADFKQLVREQFFMLLVDERRAVAAIPELLAKDRKQAARMADLTRSLIEVVGVSSPEAKLRLAEIESMFEMIGRRKETAHTPQPTTMPPGEHETYVARGAKH
jgi:hypothetical protein